MGVDRGKLRMSRVGLYGSLRVPEALGGGGEGFAPSHCVNRPHGMCSNPVFTPTQPPTRPPTHPATGQDGPASGLCRTGGYASPDGPAAARLRNGAPYSAHERDAVRAGPAARLPGLDPGGALQGGRGRMPSSDLTPHACTVCGVFPPPPPLPPTIARHSSPPPPFNPPRWP